MLLDKIKDRFKQILYKTELKVILMLPESVVKLVQTSDYDGYTKVIIYTEQIDREDLVAEATEIAEKAKIERLEKYGRDYNLALEKAEYLRALALLQLEEANKKNEKLESELHNCRLTLTQGV